MFIYQRVYRYQRRIFPLSKALGHGQTFPELIPERDREENLLQKQHDFLVLFLSFVFFFLLLSLSLSLSRFLSLFLSLSLPLSFPLPLPLSLSLSLFLLFFFFFSLSLYRITPLLEKT